MAIEGSVWSYREECGHRGKCVAIEGSVWP